MPGTPRYTKSQIEQAMVQYIELGNSINKTSEATGIPYTTIRKWLTKTWVKEYITNYECAIKNKLASLATQRIISDKVELLHAEMAFHSKADAILSMIEDRVLELIPKEDDIRKLSMLYKAVADVKYHRYSGEDTPDAYDEKRQFILNIIDKQLVVKNNPDLHKMVQGSKK